MIAVIGATGNTGRATVKELKALGDDPLCVVRNPDKAREVLGADAKTVVAEVTDRAALEKALKGIKRVFIVTGHNPQTDEQQINVLEAAKAAGAEYFIKISGGPAVVGPDVESIVGRCHHKIEQAMKASGLRWTVLRPGLFMQNTLGQAASIKNDGKIVLAFPKDKPLNFIDTRDAGAVGARVIHDAPKYAGQTIEYSGKLTTYEQFAADFSAVLGKPVTYVEATLEQAEAAMKRNSLPDWLVTHLISLAKIARNGGFSTDKSQVTRDILGREPISTRQFVTDFKAVFA